ncbi:MAG: pilus assembly protein [Proteobacteria bacterium]|nr:pilus assembly protein [Pseudomonadota bacterium]
MGTHPLFAMLARRLRRFTGDERAISAVEFAMLLPVMLMLYLGGIEVSQAVSADRKMTLVARTVGDLVSQVASVSNADMANILNATSAVATPFPSANLKVRVSSVTIDSTGKAMIAWSDHLNWSARSGDVSTLIPLALKIPSTSLIWSESSYNYKPTIGYVITGTLTLTDRLFLRPRLTTSVARTP